MNSIHCDWLFIFSNFFSLFSRWVFIPIVISSFYNSICLPPLILTTCLHVTYSTASSNQGLFGLSLEKKSSHSCILHRSLFVERGRHTTNHLLRSFDLEIHSHKFRSFLFKFLLRIAFVGGYRCCITTTYVVD